jgi:predicted transcriptional regulator of viral defense system
MARSTIQVGRSLLSRALEQGGYFTAKQAREIGYDYPHLEYHESTGHFAKVGHGLYRLSTLPPGENDDLIRLSLWSRDRADRPQAVVSHESGLVLHELSELLPARVHLTVPPTFRKKPPPGVVLHKAALAPADVEERVGFRVTTPLRTLLDAAASGTSREQLAKAVREALGRGLVRKSKLAEAADADPRFHRVIEILGGAA